MDLQDGRELAWLELGDPEDPVVFVFHGTPGSRLQVSFDVGPINAAGVRFIAVDRPGFGHSTFQRVRRLTDWAAESPVSRTTCASTCSRWLAFREEDRRLRHARGFFPIVCSLRASSANSTLTRDPFAGCAKPGNRLRDL